MTEVTIFYTDSVVPFYQTAGGLVGYMWCEQDGKVVWGAPPSPTAAPTAIAPAQTGNTLTDITNWITAVIADASGDAASPYVYPGVILGDWGTAAVPAPNVYKSRPFCALAYFNSYSFGAMNIPPNEDGAGPRKFYYSILGFGPSEGILPGFADIKQFIDDNTYAPTFLALELHPE